MQEPHNLSSHKALGSLLEKFLGKDAEFSGIQISAPSESRVDLPQTRTDMQKRSAFRAALLKDELVIDRFWIHDPDVRFSKSSLGPTSCAVMFERGVFFDNISATGALFHLVMPESVNLLQVISLSGEEEENMAVPPFRDISLILNPKGPLGNILICANTVRALCVRRISGAAIYALGVRFCLWANADRGRISWHKALDSGGIQPVATWVSRRQLTRRS